MIKVKVTYAQEALQNAIKNRRAQAEHKLAIRVREACNEFVPLDTGAQRRQYRIEGNSIIYYGPYVRYLWEGKRMVNSATGKGPMYIPAIGYRWPKGAKLVATGEPLHYHTPGTGDHWLDRAKEKYMHNFIEFTEENF